MIPGNVGFQSRSSVYHMYVFKQYSNETKPSRVYEGPYFYPSKRQRHAYFNNNEEVIFEAEMEDRILSHLVCRARL